MRLVLKLLSRVTVPGVLTHMLYKFLLKKGGYYLCTIYLKDDHKL